MLPSYGIELPSFVFQGIRSPGTAFLRRHVSQESHPTSGRYPKYLQHGTLHRVRVPGVLGSQC